jgi:hypothetical protein
LNQSIPNFARRLSWLLKGAKEEGELLKFDLPQALHREVILFDYFILF